MKKTDCIIIGAGLSGLACAQTLQNNEVESLIFEAGSAVGGRVQTKTTSQGFIVDVGFQVLLSSYPELRNFVDLPALNLKNFNSGALVFNGESLKLLANPVAHPETLMASMFEDLLTTKDRALVLKLILAAQFHRVDGPLGKKSTELFLEEFGFSEKFIEMFWRPFLTGIYLDSKLESGEQFFMFLMRCFSSGRVSVPEKGMAELPLQMAARLKADSIFLNQRAVSWAKDHVVLASGEKISAQKIICAFDPRTHEADQLESAFRQVSTYYFTGEKLDETRWGKWLVLVPQKFGMAIDHFCLISSVSQKYGNGQSLLSVSVVGPKKVMVSQITTEINKLAGRDLKLELVTSYDVTKALPRVTEEPNGFKIIDDVLYCGDRWTSPSINGALRSGRMAAEFILSGFSGK